MASILMVAGEGLPFIKTGGLADVIGSLPQALTERGHEVKVVMPLYFLCFPRRNRTFFIPETYVFAVGNLCFP